MCVCTDDYLTTIQFINPVIGNFTTYNTFYEFSKENSITKSLLTLLSNSKKFPSTYSRKSLNSITLHSQTVVFNNKFVCPITFNEHELFSSVLLLTHPSRSSLFLSLFYFTIDF